MRILAIAAHPDDETLGCGGTIARLAAEGHEVWCAALADGVTSRFLTPWDFVPIFYEYEMTASRIRRRFDQFRAAAAILGAKAYLENAPLEDQRLDTVPMLRIAQIVSGIVENTHAEVVYTHSGGDLNQDHVAVHRATLIATRALPGCEVKKVLAYEVPSATEWAFAQWQAGFRPNTFVDITSTLAQKQKALACYDAEMREWPHPRSVQGVETLARCRGMAVGVEAAEAFQLIRSIE